MHDTMQTAFQIDARDNVATALVEIKNGPIHLRGDSSAKDALAIEDIPVGHKIALRNIGAGEDISKYGIVIGRATKDIAKGSWVHLHNMCSKYDERSSHLDIHSGAPKDIQYE